MTPEQIRLVEESFARLSPRSDSLMERVYDRLFEREPCLRPLFLGDMAGQRVLVSVALWTIVQGLRDPGRIVPVLHDLGRRHAAYGVHPEHYAPVGEALLAALGETLGEEPGSEVMEAWAAAYGLIASTMQEGAAATSSGRAA